MATAKRTSRKTKTKQAIRITGQDASALSFVARHGVLPVSKSEELRQRISPKVARVVFKNAKGGLLTGVKTLEQLRKLSESNSALTPIRYRMTIPKKMAKAAGQV